jgi:hypothetical protein
MVDDAELRITFDDDRVAIAVVDIMCVRLCVLHIMLDDDRVAIAVV